MAKLNAPLFSFGASGKLANALVYFTWKGLDVVRSYVVPSNPNTVAQQTQRGYLGNIVDDIHAAQGLAVDPLIAGDITAYAALASTLQGAMTWFNAVVKQALTQKVASLFYAIYRDGLFTAGAGQVTCHLEVAKETGAANGVTAGNWHHGTSPTALVNVTPATIVADSIDDIIAGLAAGVKQYFQFRSTSHNDFDGTRSGIYSATPT